MQSNGQHKDDRHNDRCDVKRHQRIRPQVPAGEHRGVGQLYQQDVDGAHSGLDGDGQPQEDGDGEVGQHAGEEDVVGQQAEPVSARLAATTGRLFAAAFARRRQRAGCLPLAGELKEQNRDSTVVRTPCVVRRFDSPRPGLWIRIHIIFPPGSGCRREKSKNNKRKNARKC